MKPVTIIVIKYLLEHNNQECYASDIAFSSSTFTYSIHKVLTILQQLKIITRKKEGRKVLIKWNKEPTTPIETLNLLLSIQDERDSLHKKVSAVRKSVQHVHSAKDILHE
jgi:hypothetical protein